MMEGLKFNNVVIKLDGRKLLTLNAAVLPGETLTLMGAIRFRKGLRYWPI